MNTTAPRLGRRSHVLASLLTAVVALVSAAPAAAQPLPERSPVKPSDSLLLDIAATVVRGGAAADTLWTAPWYRHEFVIVAPDGRGVIVLPDRLPVDLGLPIAQRVIGDSLPTAFLYPPGAGHPVRYGAHELAGRRVLVWPQMDSVYGVRDPLLTTVIAIYHELFHLFQIRSQWLLAGSTEAPPEVIRSAEFQRLAAVERRLLAHAMDTADLDSVRVVLRSYLVGRDRRTSLLPVPARAAEATHEQMEGTAHYTAYRAALQATGGAGAALADLIRHDLRNTPAFDDPSFARGAYRQWHVYATGAAMAYLLDRLDPAGAWRVALEAGRAMDESLRALVR